MQTNYSDEQIKDITERMKKGEELLASVGLRIAVQIIPYLQDTQYTDPNGQLKEPIELAPTPEVIPAEPENVPVPSIDPEVNPVI